jgi:hypothetical protein
MVADELHMSKETVRNILVQDYDMRNLAANLSPRNLREEQKDRHLILRMDFAEQFQEDNLWNVSSLVMKPGVIS